MGYLKFLKRVMDKLAESNVQLKVDTQIENTDTWFDGEFDSSTYEIHAYVDGTPAGYMDFELNVDKEDDSKSFFKLISLQVDEKFRGQGVGTQLYKAFSDFYMQGYSTYRIDREFQNPEAERIFNKAIELGLVNPLVLQNSKIERTYVADLRGIIKKAENEHNDIRVFYMGELADESGGGVTNKTHSIQALLDNNEPIGYLEFKYYNNHPDIMQEHGVPGGLDVSNFYVDPSFSDQGVGEMMYGKFDEIYHASFKGWPVINYHIGGASESAFNGAVQSGNLNGSNGIDVYRTAVRIDKRTKLAVSDKVELRGFSVEDRGVLSTEEEKGGHKDNHLIDALVEGKKIGYMEFSVWHDDENPQYNKIFIENLKVDEQYRKSGVATAIYIKFDEIYNSQFPNWQLVRSFTNPIAEYTFRKCVELGYVSANMLQEENVSHDYYTVDKATKWNDLRTKLPENLRGEEAPTSGPTIIGGMGNVRDFRKVIAAETALDLRNIEVVYEGQVDNLSNDTYTEISHEIYAQKDGEEIGHLVFSQVENYPGELIGEKYNDVLFLEALYIEDLVVYPKYKGCGVDLEMYKVFGEIYEQKFAEWPVVRYYDDPESEAAFRKAIALGYVHETALNEELITRHKNNYNKDTDKVKNLREELPENVRGPEVWASRKDLRTKTAGRFDFRRYRNDFKVQVKDYRG